MIHEGKLNEPSQLNKQAWDYLVEYRQAQEQLSTPVIQESVVQWFPPPMGRFKLNFDATIFSDLNCSGVGAIIRNENREVMAALSAKIPPVYDSEEAKVLACRRALEFTIDAGFSELVIEGDNANIMRSISSTSLDRSRLGHVVEDIQCLIRGLRWGTISCIK